MTTEKNCGNCKMYQWEVYGNLMNCYDKRSPNYDKINLKETDTCDFHEPEVK